MADDRIKIGIDAELKNYDKIVQYIKDGIENGLVDGVSDKTLQKITNRLKTATEQLNLGNFDAAFDTLKKIGSSLLNVSESINVAAGAASSDLDKLTAKLAELRKQQADIENNSPKARYRELEKTAPGHYVRSKAGLQRELVGIKTEEQWQQGRGSFTGANGEAVDINYGGKTWSINSAITNLVKALNDGTLALSKEVQAAIKEFGFTIHKKDGVYAANRQDLTAERTDAVNTWKAQLENAKAKVDAAQIEVEEAEANIEEIKIQAETGEFITPIKDIVGTDQRVTDLQEDYNKAIRNEHKAQTLRSNAAEDARDAEDKLRKEVEKATGAQDKQTTTVGKAVTVFFGYQMVIRQLRRLWREAIHTITELDKQLTTQAMVTGMTREETWQLVSAYQEIAQATGLAQTTIAGVTTEYLRQGETLENALTLTKAAAAAATVAGIDASESVRYLTTAIHGFKLEAEDALSVSDKFAALAVRAATNYEDLAIALSKVASQAALAGMSMDYTLALLTTGLDVTQEAPESIGTALKTVIARMREISDYGKTLEDDVDINQVESGLRAVGIALKDGTGELRSTEEVLDDLGKKWATLTANQQAAVAKALAGTRQQSRLVAIMENYDKVLSYQETAMNSIGATTAQQVTYLEGMEAAINNLQSTYQSLIKSLIGSQEAVNVINVLRGVLEWIGNFLKQPAGRWALLSTIGNILLRSKDLIDKIRNTINQLITSLSGISKENEKIIQQQKTQLQNEQNKLLITKKNQSLTSSASRPNGWLSNVTTESTSGDMLASLSKWLLSRVAFGPGYKDRRNEANQEWRDTRRSWWQNNSLVGKIRGRQADKNTITGTLAAEEENLNKQREKTRKLLAQETQQVEEYNKALLGGDNGEVDPDRIAQAFQQCQATSAEMEASKKREAELAQTLAQDTTVLNNKRLSIEQKIQYLANKRLLEAEKEKLNKEQQTEEERKQTEENIKQLENEIKQTQEDAKQSQGGSKRLGSGLRDTAQLMTSIVTVLSTAIAWGQELADVIQNYGKELAAEALESSKRIQSEMYQNTQLKTTIATTSSTIKKLSTQVVKTTEDLQELDEAQNEFAEAIGLSKEEVQALSPQQVDDLANAKQLELDEKNQKLAQELNDTLTQAGHNRSFWDGLGNMLGKAGQGVMAGGGLGGSIGAIGGGIAGGPVGAMAVGAAGSVVGGLIGGIAGLITGGIEEITKGIIAADARNKINALLDTDEGVEQFKYALKLNYRQLNDTTIEGGKEMQEALSAMFSSVVELFDPEDFKSILAQFNYDMVEFGEYFNELMKGNLDAVQILSDEQATIIERVKAAQQINRSTQDDKEINEAFAKINSRYLNIGNSLTEELLQFVSLNEWTLTNVSNVISTFGTDKNGLQTALMNLSAWLQQGAQDSELLGTTVQNLSKKEVDAIKTMITNGRSLQDVADVNTRARNIVSGFRETQSKWNTMTESDQQRFIDENIKFFTNAEARRKFFNGEDITEELRKYQADIQTESRAMYEEQRQAALLELAKARQSGDKELEAESEAYLRIIEERLNAVDRMFDLSLDDIVKKQQDQISKLKEMYQAEEEALTDSLQKRRDAYQKYFDALGKAESLADYNQNRTNLVESMAKLAAGTDANSRNKVADLRRQLADLDKQEAQREKEEARQALLENIDTEITRIQESFDKLLKSDVELLKSMDKNTYFQYLAYLAQSGKTQEEQDLIIKQMGDLLNGVWGTKGLNEFGSRGITAETTAPSVAETQIDTSSNTFTIVNTSGFEERVTLSSQQMRQLVSQLLNTVNNWTGTSYKAK